MDPVINILWCLMGLLVGTQYAPACAGLKWYKQLLVCLIFLACGPMFIIVQIAEAILDAILPEGWDEDNDIGNFKF